WVAARLPHMARPPARQPRSRDPIRVGYLSPDLRQHPVGNHAVGLFENHDTSRFETHAFSTGPDDGSDLRKRLERSFHRFIDCQHKRDDEIA
ncbi:hypothetical protein, partial [Enterococcus faecium]|uniref:O-linked N-acetylglucosamine transferase family protein n=1 Tax=Enterococcus faecium TaxID=1352 RepID=UPI003F41EE0E